MFHSASELCIEKAQSYQAFDFDADILRSNTGLTIAQRQSASGFSVANVDDGLGANGRRGRVRSGQCVYLADRVAYPTSSQQLAFTL
jgi:hypothetical protein